MRILVLFLLLLVSPNTFAQETAEAPKTEKAATANPQPIESDEEESETPPQPTRVPFQVTERLNETEASVNYSVQSLSNGRGTWQEARVDVIHKFTKRQVLYASYSETDRFNLRDRQATVGLYQPLSKNWTLLLEAGASPTHRVLPTWSGLAQLERSLGNGWIVHGGFRRTERTAAKVNVSKFGVEKYFGSNRAAYSLSINNLEGTGTSPSQRIQYNRYYGSSPSNIGIGFSFGQEVEQIDENNVLKSDIRNLSINGKHHFTSRWGLNYGFTFHRQGNIYDRRGLNLGLLYKF